ncbi:FecR family protein [Tenacibaculum sp. 1_MG-2023]|uniref:FecR family protein n=1 Tax=Tenacibaculum sp. 1_MG-2023 TaxID=3062653 RepID=UPI0026E2EA2D|nr:FecR family protein [Tenacibaculum sp. 1_MG-2023]MDO6674246.1 FecR family protein [Tenacibaculum sp. 1_MG-2023]
MKDEQYILKWLNGEISDEELSLLKQDKNFKNLEKIAHYSSHIETPKVDIEKAFKEFELKKTTTKKSKVVPLSYKNFYKYAAAVIVLLVSSYFLLFNNSVNFSTQYAETKTFNLPDESEVILNANSTVSFNKKDWKNSRDMQLKGEAFFKVKKGKSFTVNTSVGKITVLGTQFNVKERNNYFEVKTYEGLVSVNYNNSLIKLAKGKIFKVINGKIDTLNTFNINNKSWLQDESNFKSTPLQFVLDDLQNQYGYVIKTKGVNLEQLYTGGFTHKDINVALQAVTIPLQLSYKIEEKRITIYKNGQ